jgi:hypothetical protein
MTPDPSRFLRRAKATKSTGDLPNLFLTLPTLSAEEAAPWLGRWRGLGRHARRPVRRLVRRRGRGRQGRASKSGAANWPNGASAPMTSRRFARASPRAS